MKNKLLYTVWAFTIFSLLFMRIVEWKSSYAVIEVKKEFVGDFNEFRVDYSKELDGVSFKKIKNMDLLIVRPKFLNLGCYDYNLNKSLEYLNAWARLQDYDNVLFTIGPICYHDGVPPSLIKELKK